ncbi:ceramide synthase 2 isoform X2 [Callorhinchus milii]|uniref:Ceramide synthase 3a n=2 Tax=Callorhinchus milii TaxID=7868 RepID=A0A4W3H4H1_CALMI|nr:ceramide synthase 2 isoform X2 [Callorhinchus milii]|eukprot:gi/632938567/ref/XP_007905491.1/ PREDICTED: ceramide synthase 3 isoform X2 [Callorhinchus milii]
MLQSVSDWFWWDHLWLPRNLTWTDLEDQDGYVYAKVSQLYITLPFAVVFIIVRYFFERLIATPFARVLGLKDKVRLKVVHNAILEKFFTSITKHPTQPQIEGLAKKNSCTLRQVERWFRRRRNQDRPSLLKKFREASWRFVFYLLAFSGGIAVLIDKPWFYDTSEVWVGYPKQTLLPSQYWYYIIELSFYWSLVFSIASDVKRKDFREQIIHHLATIILISFSWCANYIRVGTLVMAVHDASDILLESAKMLNYAGWKSMCNSIFIVFALVFIITRLVIFPFWIIHCTWVYPVYYYPPFFGYYFFNAMLLVLQLLHIFWAYLILQMLSKFLFNKLDGDDRSDQEECDMSDDEDESLNNGAGSNSHPLKNRQHDHIN